MLKLFFILFSEVILKIAAIIVSSFYLLELKKKKLFLTVANGILITVCLIFFISDYFSYIRKFDLITISYVFCFAFFFYTFYGLFRIIFVKLKLTSTSTLNKLTYELSDILSVVSKNILENFIIIVPLQFFFIENDLYVLIFIILFSMLTCFLEQKFLGSIKIENIILSGVKSVFFFFILIGTYNFFALLFYMLLLFLYKKCYECENTTKNGRV